MIHLQRSIPLDVPVPQVWQALAGWMGGGQINWMGRSVLIRWISGKGTGSIYEFDIPSDQGGGRQKLRVKVTRYEPPGQLSMEMEGQAKKVKYVIEIAYAIHRLPVGTTELNFSVKFESTSWLIRFVSSVFMGRRKVSQLTDDLAERIKQSVLIQSGAPPPQAGGPPGPGPQSPPPHK